MNYILCSGSLAYVYFYHGFWKYGDAYVKIVVYYSRHAVKYLMTHDLYLETEYSRVWCPLGLKPMYIQLLKALFAATGI
jgi:hypothetical protein